MEDKIEMYILKLS